MTNPVTEWIGSGFSGITYVSGTQFTVTGDQTLILTLNRRLKTTNTAGTIYSYISAVDYNVSNAGKTTVTTVNDSGVLDSGLSAISYGIVNPAHSSLFPANVTQAITFTGLQTFSPTSSSPVTPIAFSNLGSSDVQMTGTAGTAQVQLGANHSGETFFGSLSNSATSVRTNNLDRFSVTAQGGMVTSGSTDQGAGTANFAGSYDTNNRVYSASSLTASSLQTVTANGQALYAHGLGVHPSQWTANLQCTSADNGYSSGDEIPITTWLSQTGGHGMMAWVDSTYVGVSAASITAISVNNKTTGGFGNLDLSTPKWKVIFRVWK